MLKLKASITGPQAMKPLILLLLALLVAGAAAGVTLSLTQAQSANGVYDTDGDKLIEISYLEQLDALRYDRNGDGAADKTGDVEAYTGAFPVPSGSQVCISGCTGYELSKSLDFDQAGSYRSGVVSTAWTDTSGNGWTPIIHTDANDNKKGYNATFEGNGKTISNLYSKSPSSGTNANRDTGLFGILGSGADVKNLGLLEVSITGRYNDTGALAARNKGKITGSYASGSVVGKGDVGGLVGNNESTGTLTKSYTSGYVASGENGVGGLVGDNFGSIIRSYSSSNVVSPKNFVGGLAGYSVGSITHSYATGKVEGGVGNQRGGVSVGGLLGKNLGTVTASYATGNASGKQDVGGLAGHNVGNITGSYASGSVSASQRHAGGLVGANSANEQGTNKIQSSYATGSVSGGSYAGGLVGENDAKVENSYSIGPVTGTSNTGGLIGGLSESGTSAVSASYWNTDTSGIADTAGEELKYGDGKTTGDLIAPTSATGIYANWGTSSVWDFGTASQYPALKADLNGDDTATVGEFGSQRTGIHAPTLTPTPTPTPTATPAPTPTPTGIQSASATSVNPSLSAEGKSATTLKLTISNYGGNGSSWHYKHTTPTGGSCSTAVKNKTAVTVTGLSINTAYTFAAYDNSSCETLLATASSASTLNPSLAASEVTANSAKITISGWKPGTDGSWYYKANLTPYDSCSAATTSSTVSLSGLMDSLAYDFKAYRGSSCIKADELAAAPSFTPSASTSTPTPTPTPAVASASVATATPTPTPTPTPAYTGSIILSESSVTVPEGGTATYTVSLSEQPTGNVNLWLRRNAAGDSDITTHLPLMVFSPSTYTDFTVTLTGAEDDDKTNGTASIIHNIQNVSAVLSATEDDNDVLTASDPTATTVLLRLGGHSRDWWFQRAGWTECRKAPDNDSDGTSDNSFRLTGLAVNANSYITAYSKSTCASADEVAQSNRFDTLNPVLSVTNVTHNSARVTLFAWDLDKDGNWHYGKSNTWCSGPVSQRYSDRTGLTGNTEYEYAAYSDSSCATKVASSVTFTTNMTPVSVSNLNTSGNAGTPIFGIYSSGVNFKLGNSFTTGSAANGYLLKSVTARIETRSTQPITAKLYTPVSGPTQLQDHANLGTVTPTASGQTVDLTFTCDSGVGNNNCDLSKDTTYWVTLEVTPSNCTSPCEQAWSATSSTTETNAPSGAGWTIRYRIFAKQDSASWYVLKNSETTRMQVNALAK